MTDQILTTGGHAPAGGEGGAPASNGGGGPAAVGGAPSSNPGASQTPPAGGGENGGTPPASPPPGDAGNNGTLAAGNVVDKTPSAPPTWPDDWRQRLAGEDKTLLKQLERMTDPSQLYKSYRELQAKLTSGNLKAPPPAADAPAEELATWRKENGIPDAADGYIEKLALPKGMVLGDADKPIVASFASRAHQLNMPPDQFNGMVSQYYEMLDAQHQQTQEADQQFKITAQDALNKEWGADYRANINGVANLLAQAPDGVADRLFAGRTADGKRVGDDPDVLRWLAGLAREINPMGSLMPAGTTNAIAAGESRIKEIEDMMKGENARRDYWGKPEVQEEYGNLLAARERMQARG